MDLFNGHSQSFRIAGCNFELIDSFLEANFATTCFNEFLGYEWKQEYINIMGKEMPIPRKTCWFSKNNKSYMYSGIKVEPIPFTETLHSVCSQIESKFKICFNSVLLNLYNNGEDSVSWHADDERSLGEVINVASLSLGASRKFQIRENVKGSEIHNINLEHNSLLFMHDPAQSKTVHQIPKTKSLIDKRINLTFRYIV